MMAVALVLFPIADTVGSIDGSVNFWDGCGRDTGGPSSSLR
ncbi:MAG: hypothetical protein Ct9H300mP11_14290 [Chloroflexota bacterium]|nr:MAG: hypothetical protein Ct9H300mP11_14290 [Chloroflexota bacterium]